MRFAPAGFDFPDTVGAYNLRPAGLLLLPLLRDSCELAEKRWFLLHRVQFASICPP